MFLLSDSFVGAGTAPLLNASTNGGPLPERRAPMVRSAVARIVPTTLALVGTLVLSACGAPQDGAESTESASAHEAPVSTARGLAVETEVLAPMSVAQSFSATGSVTPWELISVSSASSGLTVEQVLVEEGGRVDAGQVLARLDTDQLEAQRAEQLAVVDSRTASLEAARKDVERARQLLESHAISQQSAEEKETTLNTAQAALDQARASLRLLEVQIAQAEIKAPVSGTIAAPPAKIGTVVQAGSELFQIIRDDRLEIEVDVPQQYLTQVAARQAVTVMDGTTLVESGAVRLVSQRVDEATRLGTVYVAIASDTRLKVGMYARVQFELDRREELTVPQSALVWRDGAPAVFLLTDGGTAELVKVSIGPRHGGRVVIAQGLAAGEVVVTTGAAFVHEGATVRVAEASFEPRGDVLAGEAAK